MQQQIREENTRQNTIFTKDSGYFHVSSLRSSVFRSGSCDLYYEDFFSSYDIVKSSNLKILKTSSIDLKENPTKLQITHQKFDQKLHIETERKQDKVIYIQSRRSTGDPERVLLKVEVLSPVRRELRKKK